MQVILFDELGYRASCSAHVLIKNLIGAKVGILLYETF